ILALPEDEMRRIRTAHKIDSVDAAILFLPNPLKDSLGPGAFNARGDTRISCLERSGEFLRDVQFERAVERNLALLARCGDQGRRERFSLRQTGPDRLRKHRTCAAGERCFQQFASGPSLLHGGRSHVFDVTPISISFKFYHKQLLQRAFVLSNGTVFGARDSRFRRSNEKTCLNLHGFWRDLSNLESPRHAKLRIFYLTKA